MPSHEIGRSTSPGSNASAVLRRHAHDGPNIRQMIIQRRLNLASTRRTSLGFSASMSPWFIALRMSYSGSFLGESRNLLRCNDLRRSQEDALLFQFDNAALQVPLDGRRACCKADSKHKSSNKREMEHGQRSVVR